MAYKQYKIVILGEQGSGKTTWVKRYFSGNFEHTYRATEGVNITNGEIYVNGNKIDLKIWDCAGQEKLSGLGDAYWLGADGFLIFVHPNHKSSFSRAQSYIKEIRRLDNRREIPIVLCFTHADKYPIKAPQLEMQHCSLSSYSNINFEEPLTKMFSSILQCPAIITEPPFLANDEILVN